MGEQDNSTTRSGGRFIPPRHMCRDRRALPFVFSLTDARLCRGDYRGRNWAPPTLAPGPTEDFDSSAAAAASLPAPMSRIGDAMAIDE